MPIVRWRDLSREPDVSSRLEINGVSFKSVQPGKAATSLTGAVVPQDRAIDRAKSLALASHTTWGPPACYNGCGTLVFLRRVRDRRSDAALSVTVVQFHVLWGGVRVL